MLFKKKSREKRWLSNVRGRKKKETLSARVGACPELIGACLTERKEDLVVVVGSHHQFWERGINSSSQALSLSFLFFN